MAEPQTEDLVVGHITVSKVLLADGTYTVISDNDGLNVFEIIGMLTAEADSQRHFLTLGQELDDDDD